MKLLRAVKRVFVNSDRSAQLLAEIREGIANMAGEMNRHESESRAAFDDSSRRNEQLLLEIRDGIANLTDVINRRLAGLPQAGSRDPVAERSPRNFQAGRPHGEAGGSEGLAQRGPDGSNSFYRGGD